MRITLSLPDDVVATARVEAALAGKSLSAWIVGEIEAWLAANPSDRQDSVPPPPAARSPKARKAPSRRK